MKNHLIKSIELLKFNWRTLILFEIFYRLLWLAIIFPTLNQLLYLSIKLTGNEYLVNSSLSEYLSRPSTIGIALVMFLITGIYITYEVVVLSIFFHSSYYKIKIGIYTLIYSSLQKLKMVLKKYNILIIISSMIFLFIVEGLHLVGIASTIEIPAFIYEELKITAWFYSFIVIIVIIVALLFIETIFFELQCTIESSKVKDNFAHSNSILKNNRPKIAFEFVFVNFVLNVVLYLFYFIIIAFVGLMILLFNEDNIVYPFILTFLYTIYLVIGFIATVILIPVNFSLINVWYYENQVTVDIKTHDELKAIMDSRHFSSKFIGRFTSALFLVLIIIIIFIFTSISNNPSHFELFNSPYVISHRGGGNYAPENTISGINKGIAFGADAIEIDVRFTSDGVPILMHDPSLGRTTDDSLNRQVDSLTLEEIQLLDAGSWYSEEYAGEQVPTLLEAIDVIDKKVEIFLELKTSSIDEIVIILDIIEQTEIQDRIKILSFNSDILEEIKGRNKNIETVLLLSSFIGDINKLASKSYIDYYGLNNEVVSNNVRYISFLQESGKGVYVWTVDDEEIIIEMITLNVNGIITDSPLLTRELIYSDSKKSSFTQLLEKLFTREQ